MGTCEVWGEERYMGRVPLTEADWLNATNWRQAAHAAARRVFGPGRWHVTEQAHVGWERL